MQASIIAVFLNLILNYILIFGKLGAPVLGVTGAAIATNISRQIKAQLGGEWFTFVSIVGDKAYNFALTCVSGGDFLAFSINDALFQICRLRQR